jgi:hypothetical protein
VLTCIKPAGSRRRVFSNFDIIFTEANLATDAVSIENRPGGEFSSLPRGHLLTQRNALWLVGAALIVPRQETGEGDRGEEAGSKVAPEVGVRPGTDGLES